MRNTFEYFVYPMNVNSRNHKSRRSYVSFGDVCSNIEFTEAWYGKLVISLSRVDIMRLRT